MGQGTSRVLELRVFAGPLVVLRRFKSAAQAAADAAVAIYEVPSPMGLTVLPVDDRVHDALHRAYGTGDWLSEGPRLSTGDLSFGLKASMAGPLAYLEAVLDDDRFHQAAVVWRDGAFALRPQSLILATAETEHGTQPAGGRQRSLWPLNQALQQLGVTPTPSADALEQSGLAAFADNDELRAASRRIDT